MTNSSLLPLRLARGVVLAFSLCAAAAGGQNSKLLNLPSGKQLAEPVPGAPQATNSLPMTSALSPDGRYLALVNAGYGTFESKYAQSIAILDTATGKLTDYPEARTAHSAQEFPQTLYSGLAFSRDGAHLYAALDSLTHPEGGSAKQTGNAIAVYALHDGVLTPERLIQIPLQQLAQGKKQNRLSGAALPEGTAIPAPAGIAVRPAASGGDEILVADNLSDDVLQVAAATGRVLHRFDLSEGDVVPGSYPVAVTVNGEGSRAFVALWNGSALAELDLNSGRVVRRLMLLPPAEPTRPSSHPMAMAWSPDGKTLYVALANRDAVAAVRVGEDVLALAALYDTRLPGQSLFGAMPDAVAVSPDGRRMYAANSGSDAVAVFATGSDVGRGTASASRTHRPIAAMGFIPTEWYPTTLAVKGDRLYVTTGKGQGTGPNNRPQPSVPGTHFGRESTYIATLLHGSLASIDRVAAERELQQLTDAAVSTNLLKPTQNETAQNKAAQNKAAKNKAAKNKAAQQTIAFRGGANPIKHVIYIIKENRTYDQILGDLGVGDGDPSLTMYGAEITPNQHKLARQFGVLDNFYDSGEVSGDGHVWSNAAITSDYTERTWQQSYRGHERPYDFEGVVAEGVPLVEGIPDVNEPQSGYLWTNLARHGKTLYHFGEFISTQFCLDPSARAERRSPTEGTPEPRPTSCERNSIRKGETIPDNYGGGTSPYPWAIPLISRNVATKPELAGRFDPAYPDFELNFPDQLRVEEFLTHFRKWSEERTAGRDVMPTFLQLRLPNDHTAGTRPGMPTPRASVADNDLAVGRAVEALSHSPYWDDTAFFILEDDAQNGADHVDAHRSIALVVSKYSPGGSTPFVEHGFYTTVSMIRTMEDLLGVPPMNANDGYAAPMASLFSGAGDQPAFTADYRNRDNGLLYQANQANAPGARQSSRMDFRHEDRADPRLLNVILWRDAMGHRPLPPALAHPGARRRDADGD